MGESVRPPPRDWGELSDEDRRRYQEFVDISANQLAVATIDVTKLMSSRGGERKSLIKVNDEGSQASEGWRRVFSVNAAFAPGGSTHLTCVGLGLGKQRAHRVEGVLP